MHDPAQGSLLERMAELFGWIGAIVAVLAVIAIATRNLGQFVGSVPCRRIALWSRSQRLKVRRNVDRVTAQLTVRLRMTGPGVNGAQSCVCTSDEALALADFLEEAARNASPQ